MDAFDEFKKILERFGVLGGMAVGGAVFLPFISGAAGFAPIWPPAQAFVTAVAMLVVLMLVFQFTVRIGKRAHTILLTVFALLFVGALGCYLYLFGTFVSLHPSNEAKLVLGCEWTRDARLLGATGSGCPGDYGQLLHTAGYNPSRIWTLESIQFIQNMLFLAWLASFAILAGLIGTFLIGLNRFPAPGPSDQRHE